MGVNWQVPNIMLVQVFSPIDIQIVSSDGKWAGKNILNLPETDRIAGAYYTGFGADAEFATVPNPSGKYKIITQGTGAGDYTVETTVLSKVVGNDQVQESSATIQGTTVLGKEDQLAVEVNGGVVTDESDILAPVIKTFSPDNGKTYLNNQNLPINYQITDNKTIFDKIKINVYLDNATTTFGAIDLAYQKTGSHILKITAQDEAGNIGQLEIPFTVAATTGSIISNIQRFSNLGLINKTEKTVLTVLLQAIQVQLDSLAQIQNNTKLSANAKKTAIAALNLAINKQIDAIIKEINVTTGKLVNASISGLLVDSLNYIKIK